MKWKKTKKPFLILPLEVYDLTTVRKKNTMLRKKPNLKLLVLSNKENNPNEEDRPLTATLEKPQILNIKFLGKIDMSLMRKEFLTISNLCRVPLAKVNNLTSTKSNSAFKVYRKRGFQKMEETEEDTTSGSEIKMSNRFPRHVKRSDVNCDKKSVQGHTKLINPPSFNSRRTNVRVSNNINDASNNRKNKSTVGAPVNKPAIKLIKQQSGSFSCSSCGRNDKPERFHTHPDRRRSSLSPSKRSLSGTTCSDSNIVLGKMNKEEKKGRKDLKLLLQDGSGDRNGNLDGKRKGPRTLICYLCGREYGTTSLKLHEPKCLEKWQRENSKLPKHLRRKLPQKPDESQTLDEWNNNAWKTMQNSLVPCNNCGRTFLPDRLEVHLRSCKNLQNNQERIITKTTSGPTLSQKTSSPPRGIQCSLCGKSFGIHSIKIHQESCVKKVEQNNNYIESSPKSKKGTMSKNSPENINTVIQEKSNPNSGKRPRILPCYICGRPFSISSISIHEPQCLKKWKIQNDKLPSSKRRPEPKKPDFVFTSLGDVDYEGTFDRMWENHLSELIPCKTCGRTFFPDRIEKHENSCAMIGVKIKTSK